MKTFYVDLGFQGGVVVIADNEEEAMKLVKKESIHGDYIKEKLTQLNPGEVYTFMGDS